MFDLLYRVIRLNVIQNLVGESKEMWVVDADHPFGLPSVIAEDEFGRGVGIEVNRDAGICSEGGGSDEILKFRLKF